MLRRSLQSLRHNLSPPEQLCRALSQPGKAGGGKGEREPGFPSLLQDPGPRCGRDLSPPSAKAGGQRQVRPGVLLQAQTLCARSGLATGKDKASPADLTGKAALPTPAWCAELQAGAQASHAGGHPHGQVCVPSPGSCLRGLLTGAPASGLPQAPLLTPPYARGLAATPPEFSASPLLLRCQPPPGLAARPPGLRAGGPGGAPACTTTPRQEGSSATRSLAVSSPTPQPRAARLPAPDAPHLPSSVACTTRTLTESPRVREDERGQRCEFATGRALHPSSPANRVRTTRNHTQPRGERATERQ